MKWLLSFFLFLLYHQADAQKLTGIVKDFNTQLPIENVQIYSVKQTTYTDRGGKFIVEKLTKGDHLSLRLMGYQTVEFVFGGAVADTTIFLQPIIVSLDEVKVQGKRNYKLDSLNLRKEYAKVFNATPTKLTDIFIKRNPNYKNPFPGMNPNSTSSLVSVNVLQIVDLILQKKYPMNKLKSSLLKEEENRYADHVFSKATIGEITGLKGNELIIFTNRYRPDAAKLKKMNSYEIILYIKQCYAEFIKP